MPAISSKQLVAAILTAGKKSAEASPPDLPVLEQLLYAVLREAAPRDRADRAFLRLREQFYDWNEIRVSSPHELLAALDGLPDPLGKANRLIQILQEVFESTYSFDLESLHKKGLKQSAKQLSRYQGVSDYSVAWVIQQSLGGHAIPLDDPSLRVLRRLGLADGGEVEAIRGGIEHQVPKAKGLAFVELLSAVAHEQCHETAPQCGQCPLRAECPTGRAAPAESARPPRKSR